MSIFASAFILKLLPEGKSCEKCHMAIKLSNIIIKKKYFEENLSALASRLFQTDFTTGPGAYQLRKTTSDKTRRYCFVFSQRIF